MAYANENDLGIAGLALLRKRLIGNKSDSKFIVSEIRRIVDQLKTSKHLEETARKNDVVSGYKSWSDTYDSIPNLLIEVEEPEVKTILQGISPGKALDAGCGDGRLHIFLHSLVFEVTGVDISSTMLQKARLKNRNINFIVGNLENLPIDDSNFDLATCALALTHFKNIDKSVSELSRVVRRGGYIVISDIHPLLVTLGGQADFHDKFGNWRFITNYVHWYTNYLHAFDIANLRIMKCLEPLMNSKQVRLAQTGSQLNIKTISAALRGLPIAIIWILEKI